MTIKSMAPANKSGKRFIFNCGVNICRPPLLNSFLSHPMHGKIQIE
jgi:hypothetical protein